MLNDSASQFSLFERLYSQNKSNMFINKTKMLAYWSQSIEKKVIEHGIDTPIYVGLQRLSEFNDIACQYQKIADTAPVWILGEADQTKPVHNPMIRFINLEPFTKLTQEWFIVVNHPCYRRALVARQITSPKARGSRQFEGVITSDPNAIQFAYESIEEYVNSYKHLA